MIIGPNSTTMNANSGPPRVEEWDLGHVDHFSSTEIGSFTDIGSFQDHHLVFGVQTWVEESTENALTTTSGAIEFQANLPSPGT